MTAIFFKVTDRQNSEIKSLMEEEGYTNKAEFFRFLVKFFKYKKSSENQDIERAASELAKILKELDRQGKLGSSIDEQLSDV